MFRKVFTLLPLLLLAVIFTSGQRTIPLYKEAIPNSIPSNMSDEPNRDSSVFHRVVHPSLTLYMPPPTGKKSAAVVICAGGGYAELNIKREGYKVAEAFTKEGVAAFVLKYRLPDDRSNRKKSIAPLQDAQQAIKLIRDSAAQWNIDPAKIGIMGFSAGGHLASSAGVHYNDVLIPNETATSLRPDFLILVYPVISFGEAFGHRGSRDNLLGKNPSADSIRYFSNELQVTAKTPQTFLVHSGDDKIVPVENSIRFYETLNKQGVNADLHIYAQGGHGFGVMPRFDEWFGRCLYWMRSSKLLD